ncbi:hypothetical protein LP316_05950 [Thalassotalea sp. LPB0316]|nr:hypothetical protein LP316_05950 [Thalassotalea sp. LPB0316]
MLLSFVNKATVIVGNPTGDAIVTAAPLDGYTYLVPESNPIFNFTAMGGVSSEIQWESGSLDDEFYWVDYLKEPQNFNQPANILFYYGFKLNGSPALTLEKWLVGQDGSDICTQQDYPDQTQTRTFYCGTAQFSKIDVLLPISVPEGRYQLQLIHQVIFETSEILVADSELISFEVKAVPVFEPTSLVLFSLGVLFTFIPRRDSRYFKA